MKTLSIISHKGGAGKTSSAVMLAEDFARRGLRVVLVDADRQKGAGLLLGIEQPTGSVQQTRDPKLRYFCSSGIPLRELPAKAEELAGLVDLAVIDTPSLDDPLAKGWIQLSSHALVVIPVEPLSIRTMDGADAAFDAIQRLNPRIELVGVLPTMFDETDSVQRSLLLELRAQRPEDLLPGTIPHDPGMVHRAEQKEQRRTEPSAETRAAYHAAGDHLMKAAGLAGAGSTTWQRPAAPAVQRASVQPAAPVRAGNGAFKWVVAAVAAILVLAIMLGVLFRPKAAERPVPGGKPSAAVRSGHSA